MNERGGVDGTVDMRADQNRGIPILAIQSNRITLTQDLIRALLLIEIITKQKDVASMRWHQMHTIDEAQPVLDGGIVSLDDLADWRRMRDLYYPLNGREQTLPDPATERQGAFRCFYMRHISSVA